MESNADPESSARPEHGPLTESDSKLRFLPWHLVVSANLEPVFPPLAASDPQQQSASPGDPKHDEPSTLEDSGKKPCSVSLISPPGDCGHFLPFFLVAFDFLGSS